MLLKLLYLLVVVILWYFLWKWYVRMFQQNSYYPERFHSWLWRNPIPRFGSRVKVPFVMTARMKRLTLTFVLLVLVICGLSLLYPKLLFVLTIAGLLCTPYLLLLANLINSPVEKTVTGHYIADARRIIRSHSDLIIIGVTGSYGKTSTKNYLYRILSEKYNVLMTPGNYNTLLGVVRTIREQLKPYHEVFIVEMGARQKGDIKEICNLVHPTIGIVTAVGEMHLETFGSIDNVLKTKFELIDSLPSSGHGFVCAESEPIGRYLASENFAPACEITSYGIDAHRCDVRAASISYSPAGTAFSLIDAGGSENYSTPLFGKANVLDLSAAILVSRLLAVSEQKTALAARKLQPVEHRLSVTRRGGCFIIDDAYNSNPVGAEMALQLLASFAIPDGGKRVCVTPGFVELGPRQEEECRRLGSLAARSADYLVIVNKYNRAAILRGAEEAGMSRERILLADTLSDVPALLGGFLTLGSVILYENDLPDSFR